MTGEQWGSARTVVTTILLVATTAPVASAVAVGTGVGPSTVDGRVISTDASAVTGTGSDAAVGVSQSPRLAADAPSDRNDYRSGNYRTDRLGQADSPTGNNSTVHHRNPSEVASASGPSPAERLLASGVAESLAEETNLTKADRRRARQFARNNPEYAELMRRYSEAAERAEGSNRTVEPFSRVGVAQQKFLANVQQYRQTYRKYDRARTANRTLRARRLAHLLERRIATVNRTARLLNRSYANLSSEQQAELGNVTRTIGDIRANVTAMQQAVRRQTLVRTRLSVRTNASTASFTDPVQLTGRLRTADGTPVRDETVTLQIGNRTLNVTTDERGRFRETYRPVVAEVGTDRRTFTFRPANESVYRRASASVRLTVEQVTPNVTVTERAGVVRYNETLDVTGRVEAGGAGTANIPLVVTVDGVAVERVQTGPNGSFSATPRLPANVSNGSARVAVRLPVGNLSPSARRTATALTNRALAPANASTQVTVESTSTAISITNLKSFDRTALVTGRLWTNDGEPLPNQTVTLRVAGTAVGNATTNATGGFVATVRIPSDRTDAESLRVAAVFPPTGNLESARTNATVTLPSGGTSLSNGYVRLGVASLLGVAVVGVAVWRFRSDGEVGGTGLDPDVGERDERGTPGRSPEELLDSANRALGDDEYDGAAMAAYASVRQQLRDGDTDGRIVGDRKRPRTHWEVYAAWRDADPPDDALARLERLTGTYERAAFADESVSASDAREAVADAEALRLESLTGRRDARRTP